MTHHFLTDNFVFCCLSREQDAQLKTDIENKNFKTAFAYQENLKAEKHGYRCSICGKFYPYLQINYRDSLIDPNSIAKLKPTATAYKKAAALFCGDHYYAYNKKTLLKVQLDADAQARQTDVIPIMGGVYHANISQNEEYLATENFSGTLGIYDLRAKQLIGKKLHREVNGTFLFSEDNRLLYYFQDAIRCWDFRYDREDILWTVPEEWKCPSASEDPLTVVCRQILYNPKEKKYLFQCAAGNATYIVSIKDMAFQSTVTLPRTRTRATLVYAAEPDQYTLATQDEVIIYDSSFNIVESFPYPRFVRTMNGGGVFPITCSQGNSSPGRVFLSPDGKWLLLDYFNHVVLMEHGNHDLKYCLFSYTGNASRYMGFLDSKHFWYTWGDTTYIQRIPD